jgi:alpha-2-macroglobulin
MPGMPAGEQFGFAAFGAQVSQARAFTHENLVCDTRNPRCFMSSSRWRHSPTRLFAGFVCLALVASFPLGFLYSNRPIAGNESEPITVPGAHPRKLVAAKNPVQLTVLVEPGQLLGWISGTAKREGATVIIRQSGRPAETTKVDENNGFTWSYRIDKEIPADVVVGDLRQKVILAPPRQQPPTVFFVLDRLVFRPGQTLHFAAFLREIDARGEFVPIANKPVEVQLTSASKKTTIKKWNATADDFGKIVGDYTFGNADPLDGYSLSIKGHAGSAEMALAEYRKLTGKVRLSGTLVGGKLKLQFGATDFQGQPTPAEKIQLVTQIVRSAKRTRSGDMNPSEFVYANKLPADRPSPEKLGEDEQLLAQFHAGPFPPGNTADVVYWENKNEAKLDAAGQGHLALEIPEKWRYGQYSAIVRAVLTDSAGREIKAIRTFRLDGSQGALRLSLVKTLFAENETIRVKAESTGPGGIEGAGSLVAFRLTPPTNQGITGTPPMGQFVPTGFGGPMPGGFNTPGGFSMGSYPMPNPGWRLATEPSTIERKFVTAAIFRGEIAELKLSEPGAYKLVAVWNNADGQRLQEEIGCVVQKNDDLAGLSLHLDKEMLESGDTLAGSIQSRFSDALVLLVLRDSSGFRWSKPIRLHNGRAAFNQALPKNLRYGACVEALYVDRPAGEEPPYHASRFVHVMPLDRTIAVTAKHKSTYEPGDKAVIDLEVNRKEAVDLIVSVFDRALLDVHDSKRVDISNFYLADDRVRDVQTRELLRRKLGGVTLVQLVRRAVTVQKILAKDSPDAVPIADLIKHYSQNHLTIVDVATLLRLAGLRARPLQLPFTPAIAPIRFPNNGTTLLQALEGTRAGWKIHVSPFYDEFILAEMHPIEWPNPYAPRPIGMMGFNPTGFSGMSGFGSMMGINGWTGMSGMMGMRGGMMGMGGGMMGFGGGMMGAGGMGGGGFQGFYSHLPATGLTPDPKRPDIMKVPGGLDTGEAWIRRDFADLAYWNANVRTDENGKARVEFKLPDSLTSWQIQVTAISKAMHVGSAVSNLQTVRPIMVRPVLPRFFAEGDEVTVSAIVYNRSGAKQKLQAKLETKNGRILTPEETSIEVADKSQSIVSWRFKAGEAGYTQLLLSASGPGGKDASLKRLPVIRAGAEQAITWSGYAKGQAVLHLPDGIKPEEAKLEIAFAPSQVADLMDTLDYLVEYPYGCVEQTMSRFLPAVKVAQVLKRRKIERPTLTKKLPECVGAGIRRLLELQLPDGGWGWNGNGRPHELMTPYALLGLIEAEKAGYTIPSETAVNSGLSRLRKFIDAMAEAQAADRIYCMAVYALKHELPDEWWQFVEAQADAKRLSDYALALSLEMAVRRVRTKLADKLALQLRERASESDGAVSWRTAGFSRWGEDPFEITAAAMKALVAYDKDDPLIPKVLDYFAKNKRGDRWNSTKDTAMIVYATCDYLERQKEDAAQGAKVVLRVNDGEPIEVKIADHNESSKIVVNAKHLREGRNVIRFTQSPLGMLVRARVRYVRSGKDLAPLENGLNVVRQFYLLDNAGNSVRKLKSGDSVPKGSFLLSEAAANDAAQISMRYLLVESAVPAGAEVIPTQDKRFVVPDSGYVLREEREGKVAFHHETAPGVVVDRCVLHLEMSGDFVIPPARAELMYQTDRFGHSGAFALHVE